MHAIVSIARKMGIGSPETLRSWVRRAERDAGQRPGLTTEERVRLKQLERENFELRRANEILKKASAYFAQAELDRQSEMMVAFIDAHREAYGVEPICGAVSADRPVACTTSVRRASARRSAGRPGRGGTRP